MAKTCRIDGPLFVNTDGSVDVPFSAGPPPLAATPHGTSIQFPSMAALQQALADLNDSFSERDLVLMNISNYSKLTNDMDLSQAKKSSGQGGLFPGKNVTMDLSIGGAKVVDFK